MNLLIYFVGNLKMQCLVANMQCSVSKCRTVVKSNAWVAFLWGGFKKWNALDTPQNSYTILHNTAQYYTVPHNNTQYYTILYKTNHITQYCTRLHITIQYYTILNNTTHQRPPCHGPARASQPHPGGPSGAPSLQKDQTR